MGIPLNGTAGVVVFNFQLTMLTSDALSPVTFIESLIRIEVTGTHTHTHILRTETFGL